MYVREGKAIFGDVWIPGGHSEILFPSPQGDWHLFPTAQAHGKSRSQKKWAVGFGESRVSGINSPGLSGNHNPLPLNSQVKSHEPLQTILSKLRTSWRTPSGFAEALLWMHKDSR